MKTSKNIRVLLNFLSLHDIEIMSYGLAPNPWGFCYEAPPCTPKRVHKRLNKMFDELSESEEKELKARVFDL